MSKNLPTVFKYKIEIDNIVGELKRPSVIPFSDALRLKEVREIQNNVRRACQNYMRKSNNG